MFATELAWHHESNAIVIRILQPELNISKAALSEHLNRIVALACDCAHSLRQLTERLFAKTVKKFRFVFKVEINGCRRVLYPFSYPPHRNILISFGYE